MGLLCDFHQRACLPAFMGCIAKLHGSSKPDKLSCVQGLEIVSHVWASVHQSFTKVGMAYHSSLELLCEWTLNVGIRSLCDLVTTPLHPLAIIAKALPYSTVHRTRMTAPMFGTLWGLLRGMAFNKKNRHDVFMRPSLGRVKDSAIDAEKVPFWQNDVCLRAGLSEQARAEVLIELVHQATTVPMLQQLNEIGSESHDQVLHCACLLMQPVASL